MIVLEIYSSTVVGMMGRTIIVCLQLFRSIHFRAMNDTAKFAGNQPCLSQGGSTAHLLHAKQPAVPSSPIRSLMCTYLVYVPDQVRVEAK